MTTLGRAEFKVPGGKLLRVRAEAREGRITFVRVTGDFFLTPETDLEDLEKQLIGLEADPDSVTRAVTSFFTERKTVITGATPQDFARVIVNALTG